MTKFEKDNLIAMMSNMDDIVNGLSEEVKAKYKKAIDKIDDSFYKIIMVNR